jgi:hypothetical protein
MGAGIRNRSRTPRRRFPTLRTLRDMSSFTFAQDKPLRQKSSFDYSSFVNFALFAVNFSSYFKTSCSNFCTGSGSRKPTTLYFFPSTRRPSGKTSSLGISIRIESEASTSFLFITFCHTI